MNDPVEASHVLLKQAVIEALWQAADGSPDILSATLAGSFVTGSGLDGFSDIDTIVITRELDEATFARVVGAFTTVLEPVLAEHGWRLRVNTTLGPLKFNDDRTAVLHLMLYSAEGHRQHVIKSPFTCLDWQRSACWRKSPMAAIYPVQVLQPRHFFGARRSAREYLADLEAGVISYRRIHFVGGYAEERLTKPMDVRDRHEFSYHIMKFIMQNTLKLLRRENRAPDGEALLADYGAVFPEGMADFAPLYMRLTALKKSRNFSSPLSDLLDRVSAFVRAFEQQFREEFHGPAMRQIWVRHAPTALNVGSGLDAILQGHSDPPILPIAEENLAALRIAVANAGAQRLVTSPLLRARQTGQQIAQHCGLHLDADIDARLHEINYGDCEGLTAREALERHPHLGAGWSAGQDPRFPAGECSADVRQRAMAYLAEAEGGQLVVTHNVVLREVVGELLGIATHERHRLRIPHLAPIAIVRSRRHGCFLDLDENVESQCCAAFFRPLGAP
jgi:broad specificity phosphatase PhoE